jgi:hypothetical protein
MALLSLCVFFTVGGGVRSSLTGTGMAPNAIPAHLRISLLPSIPLDLPLCQ